jgi:hypothetical protein
MNYLDRYLWGEHEQVWTDLQALGPAVREEPIVSLAREVADETMRRVRRNREVIVSRLDALGYAFGVYPDGSHGYYTQGPLISASDQTRADYVRLEKRTGPLPLSLTAFWHEVGSVDLVGMHGSWPELLDALVVYPPETAIYDLDDWEANLRDGCLGPSDLFEAGLAPDCKHKDNISGGPPYGVVLPDASCDFVLQNEHHHLLFVPYLRLAILRWGGLPGLEGVPEAFAPLTALIAGLEPF